LVEPLSIDEAYLDVTHPKKGKNSASLLAMEIKKRIKEETNLIASAGVSYNKFLAKIASDQDKPDGFFLITPQTATSFLENLDIGLFYGIGKVTEQKMHNMKIYKGRDLKKLKLEQLTSIFGKAGEFYYHVVRGIDNRLVTPFRERKSIGVERTYLEDISDLCIIRGKIEYLIDLLLERMNKEQKKGKTFILKIKYSDFTTMTRSITQDELILEKENLVNLAYALLPYEKIKEKKVRLIGVSISNFISNHENEIKKTPIQLSINFEGIQ